MNKIVNCQAILPTKKPNLVHKSHHIDSNPPKNQAYLLTNRKKIALEDCIKQASNQPLTSTGFKQHFFANKDHDLASSFSFSEEEIEHQYQKLLFAKFLEAKECDWMHFMHDMNKISLQNLIGFVKIGESDKAVNRNRILSHYIGVWLQSMGYKDPQTRRKLVTTVRYIYPDEQDSVIKIATILYDTLFQGYLPEFLQLKVLLEVCKRGWEYLGLFVARFIKILKKYKNLKEESFVDQVQRALT